MKGMSDSIVVNLQKHLTLFQVIGVKVTMNGPVMVVMRIRNVQFPIPKSSEPIEKMNGQHENPQSGNSRKRKSRWDEKP